MPIIMYDQVNNYKTPQLSRSKKRSLPFTKPYAEISIKRDIFLTYYFASQQKKIRIPGFSRHLYLNIDFKWQ